MPARAWYLSRRAEHIAPGARHSPVEPCEAHSVQRRCRAAVCAAVRAERDTAFLPFQRIPCIRARWQIDFSHGLVFRQSSFLLQVTVCSASPRAGHRKGQDSSGSPFVKLLQPTLKTHQWKTSSVFSNNKEIWREASSPAYTVKPQTEEHKVISTQSSLPRLVLHCSAPSRYGIMDSFPMAINSLIPAKIQQASQITCRLKKPTTKPTKQCYRKDCFNIGQNWTCFQISKFWGSDNYTTLLFSIVSTYTFKSPCSTARAGIALQQWG